MPFTLAHPLAVVPLRRTGIPLTALVIGAMAPDLILFVPLPVERAMTHSLIGAVTIDVVIGAALMTVWSLVVARPLIDGAPTWIRERLPSPRPGRPAGQRAPGLRSALLVIAGLAIGSLTHVAWDAFTHSQGWFVARIPALRAEIGPLHVWFVLQHASSVLGVAALLVIIGVALARRPPRHRPRIHPVLGPLVVIVPLAVGALTAGAVGAALLASPEVSSLDLTAYLTVRASMASAGIALLLLSALWLLAPVPARPPTIAP